MTLPFLYFGSWTGLVAEAPIPPIRVEMISCGRSSVAFGILDATGEASAVPSATGSPVVATGSHTSKRAQGRDGFRC